MSMSLPGTHAHTNTEELAACPCQGHNDPCGKPSNHKIIVESDSFGDEYAFLCDDCYKKHVDFAKNNPLTGYCDKCSTGEVRLYHHRDIDEGSHGPVYQICKRCVDKYNTYLREELDNDRHDDDCDDPDVGDDEPWEPELYGHWVYAEHGGAQWSMNVDYIARKVTLLPERPIGDGKGYLLFDNPLDALNLKRQLSEGNYTFSCAITDDKDIQPQPKLEIEEIYL